MITYEIKQQAVRKSKVLLDIGEYMTCKLTSLQTNMVPKMTCSPSKKLSPMMMTVAPPVVQPSLGLMALIQGAAASRNATGPI